MKLAHNNTSNIRSFKEMNFVNGIAGKPLVDVLDYSRGGTERSRQSEWKI